MFVCGFILVSETFLETFKLQCGLWPLVCGWWPKNQRILGMVIYQVEDPSTNLVSSRHRSWRWQHKLPWQSYPLYRLNHELMCSNPRYQPSTTISLELELKRCRYHVELGSNALRRIRTCRWPVCLKNETKKKKINFLPFHVNWMKFFDLY